MKAATLEEIIIYNDGGFQSTPPVKAATIPSSHVGDPYKPFQSTPPVKAATSIDVAISPKQSISIHAAREGGDNAIGLEKYIRIISIHAAREGGDNFTEFSCKIIIISIHAAREGGDAQFREKQVFC